MERQGEIASALARAVERTAGDPAQAIMAQTMMTVFNAFIASGFEDLPVTTHAISQSSGEAPQPTTELDLDAEWQRRAAKRIALGFHSELGLTEEAYLATIPKFEPQPEEYRGRLDLLLLVERRIPFERQRQLAGCDISEYLASRLGKVKPYKGGDTQDLNGPYAGWFNKYGQRFANPIKPSDARKQLTADEVGAGLFEGIALQIDYPEFNENNQFFDLIGDVVVGSGRVPYLFRWSVRPGFRAGWHVSANDHFRPLVRGSKIVTG